MTNEPEPNTRAGEALLDSAVEQMGEALFNLSSRLKLAGTFTAGSPGDRNAVSYEKVVLAWQKLTGEIERSKLPTWDHYAEEHVDTRPLPQPSELVERPSEAIEVLGGPYRQLDMDGVIVGVSRQAIYETLTYLTQLEAQITKLQADGNKLAGALEAFQRHYDLNDCDERCGAIEVPISDLRRACQALTEWKDRT